MPDWEEHLRPRLAPLALSPAREREILDELTQHLDDRYEEMRAAGHAETDAVRVALDELQDTGAFARQMRALRQAHVPPPIVPGTRGRGVAADLWQDVRYAARMLRGQPAFAAAVILTLALGIGANTAVFSLVDATLFQRLPVAGRERLVYVYRGTSGVFSYPLFATLRDATRLVDGLAGWGGITASLNAGDSAELVNGVIVTGNFFDVLGIRAAHGRLLSPSDDVTPGGHPVAVISHDFWQSRFAGQPGVVGSQVRLNGHVFTIVGVTPAGFPGPQPGSRRSLYVPMMMQAIIRPPRAQYSGEQDPDLLKRPTSSWIFGVARLKPGVTIEQARAELDPVAAEFIRTHSRTPGPPPAGPHVTLLPLDEGNAAGRRQMRSAALLLGGVVGGVLLIACANIANLLLSRTAARRRELAVRLALGASRSRLVRQLLTESVLLSSLGGAAGVALAWGAIAAFKAASPPAPVLSLTAGWSIDERVLLFALVLSGVTGLVFGVAPALKASRPELVPALKDAGANGDRTVRFELKTILVVTEVALSLLLLIAAGLFVRSLHATRAIDAGVDVERLVSTPLNIHLLRYTRAQGRDFYAQVVERMERLPGVESATAARVALLGGSGRVLSLHVEGREGSHDRAFAEGSGPVSGDRTLINANVVGPRFFATLGIPLVLGRDFTDGDIENAPPVAILNATAARTHFPGAPPIGRQISVDGPLGPWREIVGIVGDSKYGALTEDAVPVVYLPLAQNHETGMMLYVRASVPPASLAGSIRREIQDLEPNLPVPDIQTMTETIGTSLYAARMGAWLLSGFAGLAGILAAVGIYGVLSFSISRRTREIGIRLALGADRRDVFLLVVRDGMLLAGLGLLIGSAGGLAAARWLAASLHGVSATDGATFGVTIAMLAIVAFAACAIPARRAVLVNPIAALREE